MKPRSVGLVVSCQDVVSVLVVRAQGGGGCRRRREGRRVQRRVNGRSLVRASIMEALVAEERGLRSVGLEERVLGLMRFHVVRVCSNHNRARRGTNGPSRSAVGWYQLVGNLFWGWWSEALSLERP